MKIANFPKDAPFTEDQKSWISGFISGFNARIDEQNDAIGDNKDKKNQDHIDIFYGTQTGTSENLAEDIFINLSNNNISASNTCLSELNLDKLKTIKKAIFVISTYGEGEMPDNAQLFWSDLSSITAPSMENVEYAVLALGDTSYEEFCAAGKHLDLRMEQLGGKRILERIDCDVDYEDKSSIWISELSKILGSKDENVKNEISKEKWNRKNPFSATITKNILLSGKDSNKEIRHYEINIDGSKLDYEVGDSINVFPINDDKLVGAILSKLNVGKQQVCEKYERSYFNILKYDFEISIPTKNFLKKMEPFLKNDEFSELLKTESKEKLDSYLYGMDILDILNLNKNISIDISNFINFLTPLQHRAYSIASSQKVHNNKIEITVSTVRWTFKDRIHNGVCSNFLSKSDNSLQKVNIFLSKNNSFRLPENDDVPIIMVGPGTGLAPFKAFLEERDARNAQGKNWLFFGDQTERHDFIYKDILIGMKDRGLINNLSLAFSRDQKEKIYVQNKLDENGADVFNWLEDGAYFYICGDAQKMAKDVEKSLELLIKKNGNFSDDEAKNYLTELKRQKRFLRDVY